jgi:hypothetical protein
MYGDNTLIVTEVTARGCLSSILVGVAASAMGVSPERIVFKIEKFFQ